MGALAYFETTFSEEDGIQKLFDYAAEACLGMNQKKKGSSFLRMMGIGLPMADSQPKIGLTRRSAMDYGNLPCEHRDYTLSSANLHLQMMHGAEKIARRAALAIET
jgi:hypothetical protein